MSGEFHGLLRRSVSRKCHKVDQLVLNNDDKDNNIADFAMYQDEENILKLFTYNVNIESGFTSHSSGGTLKESKPDSSMNDLLDQDSSHGPKRNLFWFSRSNPKSLQGSKGRPSRRLSVFEIGRAHV